jgi:hypothetical protein
MGVILLLDFGNILGEIIKMKISGQRIVDLCRKAVPRFPS